MSTYEISKSSLLSLKAEILKKQEELQKAKLDNQKAKQEHKRRGPLELKNRGIEQRLANDSQLSSDEENLLKKSRSSLELKAKLYEKLSKGSQNEIEKEHNRRYLVHFDKKASSSAATDVNLPPDDVDTPDKYPDPESEDDNFATDDRAYDAEHSDDEWIEFVDCFGRTRTCLKKDLNTFRQKDKQLQVKQVTTEDEDEPTNDDAKETKEKFDEQSELLSGDMRRELLRRQWEQAEEQLKDKSNVHYQDILFNEARTHGVGYYGFAKDEATRAQQQEALKSLRKETEEQQKQAQQVRQHRERQMAARVRAAKNRKRAREGLAPITSDDEAAEKEAEREKAAELAKEAEQRQQEQQQRTEDDKQKERERKEHIRPWDIGKEGIDGARIKSGTRDPYDQGEWNEIQRAQRNREFAPPQIYHNRTSSANPYKNSKITPTPIRNECSDEDSSSGEESTDELMKDFKRTGVNIPPPSTFDYYGPSSTKRPRMGTAPSAGDMEDAIMQGLRFLREQAEQQKKPA